ncbi:MAG: metal ABC transporter substrate-binding protein [Spirochaetota bacterium]
MKRTSLIAFVVILFLMAIGCAKDGAKTEDGKFQIVASFYPVYIIARNVADGVKGAKVINMTPPVTGCLHDYSLTSEDMKRIERAGIFLVNGAGMESFLNKITEKFPAMKIAELSKDIKLIRGKEGDNPHVWVSVSNAIVMVNNCQNALTTADPKNAGQYKENALRYTKQLEALKIEMIASLNQYRGRKIITFHEAFPYFAQEFGFKIAAVIEREPGSEPSAKEIAETIEIVRKEKIKTLFAEPQYPSSSAGTIAKETGATVYTLDPAVTGDDDKNAYINIMRKNLSVLKKAFE